MITRSEIQLVRSLADKRARTETGLFVAEGAKLIGELRNSSFRIRRIYAREGVFTGPEVTTASAKEMERLSLLKTPGDSLAVVEIPRRTPDTGRLRRSLVLALDDIQNPGNLGTIIRLADWFGIGDILCSEATADCFNPKVVQATMGAIFRVTVWYGELEKVLRPRRDARLRCTSHPQALHSALPCRPACHRVAQRRNGHRHRLCGVPPPGRSQTIEIEKRVVRHDLGKGQSSPKRKQKIKSPDPLPDRDLSENQTEGKHQKAVTARTKQVQLFSLIPCELM